MHPAGIQSCSDTDRSWETANPPDTALQVLPSSFIEACETLGISLEEGARLLQTLDRKAPAEALAEVLRTAATQECAQQAVEAIRGERRECMGGRFGPPLADQIRERVDLPPYVEMEQVTDAVLTLLAHERDRATTRGNSTGQ